MTLAVPSSMLLAASMALTACGGSVGTPDASSADSAGLPDAGGGGVESSVSSDGNGAPTPCSQLGGVCQPQGVEFFTCQKVDGGAYEYHGSIQGLCGSDPSSTCCVRPDANGGLPSQLGTDGICGSIVCAAGSTCFRGRDNENCMTSCGGLEPDAGCLSCGTITCGEGCPCLDPATNHCEC